MKLHIAFMCFLYHELKRIVKRERGYALFSRKVVAPGLNFGWIKSIACRSYLYNYRITANSFQFIKQSYELLLLVYRRQAWLGRPVYISNSSYPGSTKFPLGTLRKK